MGLPYPTKVILPFDIATAQDMNERHANDVALAAGSGLDDDAVTTNKIANQAVTADKIDFTTLGLKVGIISGSTLSTTGNKVISGLGFQPRLVRFYLVATATSSNTANGAYGVMTATNQFYSSWGSSSSGTNAAARYGGTDAAIGWVGAGSTAPSLKASYVSMNADGFTINVSSAAGTFDIGYEAYA